MTRRKPETSRATSPAEQNGRFKPRYRRVSVRIWNDSKFRAMSLEGGLVVLYLLTHPHMTSLGAMRATPEGLATEIPDKLDPKGFAKGFREAVQNGFVQVSENAPLIVLPKFIKHNPPENPNVVISWGKVVDLLPDCDLLRTHLIGVKGYVEGLGEGFAKGFAKGFGVTLPQTLPQTFGGTRTRTRTLCTKKELLTQPTNQKPMSKDDRIAWGDVKSGKGKIIKCDRCTWHGPWTDLVAPKGRPALECEPEIDCHHCPGCGVDLERFMPREQREYMQRLRERGGGGDAAGGGQGEGAREGRDDQPLEKRDDSEVF